jgi:hypothetical protein
MLGWQYVKRLVRQSGWRLSPTDVHHLLVHVTLGVVLGAAGEVVEAQIGSGALRRA